MTTPTHTAAPEPRGQVQLLPLIALGVSILTSLSSIFISWGANNSTQAAIERRVAALEAQGAGFVSCQIENASLRTEVVGLRRDVDKLMRLMESSLSVRNASARNGP